MLSTTSSGLSHGGVSVAAAYYMRPVIGHIYGCCLVPRSVFELLPLVETMVWSCVGDAVEVEVFHARGFWLEWRGLGVIGGESIEGAKAASADRSAPLDGVSRADALAQETYHGLLFLLRFFLFKVRIEGAEGEASVNQEANRMWKNAPVVRQTVVCGGVISLRSIPRHARQRATRLHRREWDKPLGSALGRVFCVIRGLFKSLRRLRVAGFSAGSLSVSKALFLKTRGEDRYGLLFRRRDLGRAAVAIQHVLVTCGNLDSLGRDNVAFVFLRNNHRC